MDDTIFATAPAVAEVPFRVSSSVRPSHGPLMHRMTVTGSVGGQHTSDEYTVHLTAYAKEVWMVTDSDGRPITAEEIASALFLPPAAAAAIQASIDNALWYGRESARQAARRAQKGGK